MAKETDLSQIHFESEDCVDDGVTIFVNRAGGLVISVVEDTWIDSFNVKQEIKSFLTKEQAEQLRDWLNEALK